MPRPKSEITDGATIGARVTKEEHEAYMRLGGARWLRAYLSDIVKRRAEDAAANQAAKSERIRTMVAVRSARSSKVSSVPPANRPFG